MTSNLPLGCVKLTHMSGTPCSRRRWNVRKNRKRKYLAKNSVLKRLITWTPHHPHHLHSIILFSQEKKSRKISDLGSPWESAGVWWLGCRVWDVHISSVEGIYNQLKSTVCALIAVRWFDDYQLNEAVEAKFRRDIYLIRNEMKSESRARLEQSWHFEVFNLWLSRQCARLFFCRASPPLHTYTGGLSADFFCDQGNEKRNEKSNKIKSLFFGNLPLSPRCPPLHCCSIYFHIVSRTEPTAKAQQN